MKKAVFALIVLLLASTIPFSTSHPWVEIFEGKVKIGETLIVGDYQIKITQGYTNNLQVPEPYAIIYKDEQIKEVRGEGEGTEDYDWDNYVQNYTPVSRSKTFTQNEDTGVITNRKSGAKSFVTPSGKKLKLGNAG